MKECKNFLKFFIGTLLIALLIFEGIVFGIICGKKGVFHSSYQSVIQDKYRVLKETNEPKIILVGGSNLAFGLDQSMLAEASGYKVASLGLHGGFGQLFPSELAKENINPGDIVLLAYEYTWLEDIGFDHLGTDLVMTGIDDHIEMYKHIPPRKWRSFIGYLFTYAKTKKSFVPAEGIYSRAAFDSETGQMVAPRPDPMVYSEEVYGSIDISDVNLSPKSIEYLKKYKELIEKKGAAVYFVSVPIIEDGLKGDKTNLYQVKELEQELIGVPYISDPVRYVFPAELMSDALYHCNSEGEKQRTQMLIEDLRAAGVIGAR